jgi:hypothetical protein
MVALDAHRPNGPTRALDITARMMSATIAKNTQPTIFQVTAEL